jgi:hypothetical protein
MVVGQDFSQKDYSTIDLSKFYASPPNPLSYTTTDSKLLTQIVPVNHKRSQTNPNIYSSIKNYGNQITMMQYYVYDTNLINHEQMFKQYNGGIVPMTYCLTYISNYAKPNDLS